MISSLKQQQQRNGFTFVEVLVALVIIAIGVTGLVSLQRTFMQSSVRAAERGTALTLAQERLEKIRFEMYEDIAAGTDTQTIDDKAYSIAWTVTPRYFNGTWVTTGDANMPNPVPPEPDAKAVVVNVSWTTRGGEAVAVSAEGWISSFEMRDGGLAVTAPPPRNEPKVTYEPGSAPEVIAIKLTDDTGATVFQVKETTRPTPTIQSRGVRRMVNFDTVTYDQATQTQRVEDFVTVDCLCSFAGVQTDVGKTPQRLILKDGKLTLDPDGGEKTTKMVGVPADSNQLDLCVECCRDHHDSSAMVSEGNVYRKEDYGQRLPSGDHRHFKMVNGYLQQASLNDDYLESCRMRRVDGFYEVYADWQMHAVTASTSNYLVNADSSQTYTDYVRDVVRSLVLGQSSPTAPTDRDATVLPGAYQLIGRAIYLDDMSTEHENAVKQAIANNEQDWLTKVPFYEVNVTLLGDWNSSVPTVGTITNQEIVTIVDPENNYYGNYSRGRLQALSSGMTTATINVQQGNTGILGNAPIHPREQRDAIADSIDITVQGRDDSDSTDLYSVSGDFFCLYNKVTGNSSRWQECKRNDYNGLVISSSDLNISCDFNYVGESGTPSYSCAGIPAGTSLSISFSSGDAGITFTPSSVSVSSISENVIQPIQMRVN